MPITYSDLHSKVVLITGIGQVPSSPIETSEIWGNGAAIALQLARQGCKIFGCDLSQKAGDLTVSRIKAQIPEAQISVVQADVTKNEDVSRLVETCIQQFGQIDILVCNVGKSAPGGPVEMSEEVWQNQLDVNLKSAFLCCKHVLSLMEAQRSGSVILLSSVAGKGFMGRSHIGYSTTKAALVSFAQTMGVRYAPFQVRVNAVVPGLIHTPLVARLAEEYEGGDYSGLVKKRGDAVPMGRMGTAIDVANAVCWLSSSEASGYVTGTNILVDGGLCGRIMMD